MIYFNIVRLFLIVWSACMLSTVEFVGIQSRGVVELDHASRGLYSKVLILSVASFLGDAAFKLKKRDK